MWQILTGLIAQGISFGLVVILVETREAPAFIALGVLTLIIFTAGFSILLDGIKSYFLGDITAELKKLNAAKFAASPPAGAGGTTDPAPKESSIDQVPIDRPA